MSTATLAPERPTHPAAEDRAPSLVRLVEIELRKSVDTRAGFWLLLVIALLSGLIVTLRLALGHRSDKTLETVFGMAQFPASVLLSVVGILLVTSEWSQRTGLTTFTLVPHRGRVIGAKLGAMVVLSVLVSVTGMLLAVAGFGIGSAAGATAGGWHLPGAMIGQALLYQGVIMLTGAAYGLVRSNSAAAIVVSFALPIAWSILGGVISGLHRVAEWLDTGQTMGPLLDPTPLTHTQWEQLGTSLGVWLVLPMLLGLVLLRRREIA